MTSSAMGRESRQEAWNGTASILFGRATGIAMRLDRQDGTVYAWTISGA